MTDCHDQSARQPDPDVEAVFDLMQARGLSGVLILCKPCPSCGELHKWELRADTIDLGAVRELLAGMLISDLEANAITLPGGSH